MRGIRKNLLFALLAVSTLLTQNVRALPVGDKQLYDSSADVVFSIGSGSAEVDCEVYKYTSGVYTDKYLYTYQISNIDSGIGLSFFSVAIPDGADAFDPDYQPLTGLMSPELWTAVGSPVQSVDALFANPIHSDGVVTTSTVLWFVSSNTPTLGNGALFGTSSGIPYYGTGNLLTPVPEPATLVLLGMGALLTLTRKKWLVRTLWK